MDRQKKADENRHNNRWAQAQQMSPQNYKPMMMGAAHTRSTLRPGNPREMNAEAEDEEIEADI